MADLSTFGARLRYLRKARNITQAEVGGAGDVARSTYAGYETGIDTPARETLIKIADLFKASLDWIEGRMHKVDMPEIGQFVDDPDKLALLAFWDGMDDDTRSHLFEIARRLPPRKSDAA